jgi:hypothetical protein
MNDEKRRKAIKEMIARSTAANTASPEAARAWLVKMGMCTKDGELRPEYGGTKPKKQKAKQNSAKAVA